MEKERLFKKLKESMDLKEEITAFDAFLGGSRYFLLSREMLDPKNFRKSYAGASILKDLIPSGRSRKRDGKVLSSIRKILLRKHKTVFSPQGKNRHMMVHPLVFENSVFGAIVITGVKKTPPADILKLFKGFTDSVIRKVRSDIELEEINKTIRPRALALSTVHTVHRLMTSTFNLNELFPKIARLALQVIRANRCSIKLVDRKRKVLLPRTTIDLRRTRAKLKKVVIGKHAPGRAVKRGVPIRGENYLATPMIDEDVIGVITLYDKLNHKEFTKFDEEIMKTLSEQAAIAIKNAQLFKEQTDLTLSSIRCIALLLEHRSDGMQRIEGFILRILSIIGSKFNMNENEINLLQYAAMLHDAGQISIPEKLLLKKSGLTGTEYDIVKMHPLKGADILKKFKPLRPIVPIIKYHHENYDGSGYPKGLKGNDIPLPARILAVVGAFEAMISIKPYRKALSIQAAVKELKRNAGIQFDSRVVEVFCEALERKDILRQLKKEMDRK